MDNFSIYGDSFYQCLYHLELVLKRCKEKNLTLNWESAISLWDRIVLGHEISKRGIEVDKAKIEVMTKLYVPKCIRDIRSFLGHAGFYRWFIKDFSKIARPLTNLLTKDVSFNFDDKCFCSWEWLKEELMSRPIISASDWMQPFEIICDASDFTVATVLGQHINNRQQMIYYSSRTLTNA